MHFTQSTAPVSFNHHYVKLKKKKVIHWIKYNYRYRKRITQLYRELTKYLHYVKQFTSADSCGQWTTIAILLWRFFMPQWIKNWLLLVLQ